MRLITIDPGLRECGVAIFERKKMKECFLVQATEHLQGAPQWAHMARVCVDALKERAPGELLVVECMQVRKNRPEAFVDIVQLAHVAGGIYALAESEIQEIYPSKWTGRRPKPANHDRIRRRLNAAETKRLEAGLENVPHDNHKELLDAIGMGLYLLKRL